jgi:hypothetical protein
VLDHLRLREKELLDSGLLKLREPNVPTLDLPDPGLNGNPAFSNQRQKMLGQCPSNG